MDDAKKLLDSLMGQTRNLDLKEAKKKKGQNFKEDDCCKFYLLGFCPQNEQLFRNTKRHLGDCSMIHSEALREEFEAHKNKEEYEAKYVRDLIRYLEGIVRTADEAVSRQARNIKAANQDLADKGINDVAKREIEKIRENCNLLLNEAEELAESGDIEGSKLKQAIFEQTKLKADDYEAKSKMPIKEEVCEICGLRPEDGDGMRKFSHTEGKIHIGFVKVREWLEKLRARQKELPRPIGGDRDRRDRDRSRSRDRSKSRKDRKRDDQKDDKDAAKGGDDEAKNEDKETTPGKDKEAAKGDADKAGEESRRDRDRDRGRGGDRDYDRDRRGDRGRGSDDRRGGYDGDRRSGGDRRDRDRGGGRDRGGDYDRDRGRRY